MGPEKVTPHKTGFPFAAHKWTDVRNECITDGEKRRDVGEGVQV